MSASSRQRLFFGLLTFSILEVYCQTFGPKVPYPSFIALLYLFAGLMIGLLPLVWRLPLSHSSAPKQLPGWIGNMLVITGLLACCYKGHFLISQSPLDYRMADMLPIIKIMGERWLAGSPVYAIIPEIWEGMQPIYLPALWLPYIPLIAAEIDLRYVNIIFLLLPLVLLFWTKDQKVSLERLLLLVPAAILLGYLFWEYSTLITLSEEPIIIGYYVLLGWALTQKNPLWFGLFLSLCLLSRYTLLFWAATYWIYLIIVGERKQSVRIAEIATVTGLLLLLISTALFNLDIFLSVPGNYLENLTDPTERWGIENIITKNLGIARLIGYEHLPFLHSALFWGSLVIPIVLFLWYHFRLKDRIPLPLFALLSLKICLVYFFNCNPMPFSYLFYTSTFFSFVILLSCIKPGIYSTN